MEVRHTVPLAAFVVSLLFVGGCAAAATATPTSTPTTIDSPSTNARPTAPVADATTPIVLSLELEPIPAQQSGQVQVSGRGFAAGESVAIAASKAEPGSDLLQLANATASSSGTIDGVKIALPDELTSGPHAIQAVGDTSGRQNTGTLWIHAPEPWIVVAAYDVQQYGDFGLVAGGFEPMEQVQVSFQPSAPDSTGTLVQVASLTTDLAGNAQWTQVKLPGLAAGSHSLVLHGQASGEDLRRDIHITPLTPTVELSPWAGPPGVPLQLNARGFAPNERVSVSLGDDTHEAGELQADEYGNLWGAGPIHVPQLATAGPLKVNLLGHESGARANPEFKVLETKPWLELTSWWGAPGSPVGFGGGGWVANEHVSFHVGNAGGAVVGESQADDNGWLHPSGEVYVPNNATDDVTFVAVGQLSSNSASAVFKVVFPFGLRPDGSTAGLAPAPKRAP